MMKHKLLIMGAAAGLMLLAAPHAAFAAEDMHVLQKQIESMEARVFVEPSEATRNKLADQIFETQQRLDTLRREAAAGGQPTETMAAPTEARELQARTYERTGEFFPEEIAQIRGAGSADVMDRDAVGAKLKLDEAFRKQVEDINKKIAEQREILRKLEAQRAAMIREYYRQIADLRTTRDLPFQPVDVPQVADVVTDKPQVNGGPRDGGGIGGINGVGVVDYYPPSTGDNRVTLPTGDDSVGTGGGGLNNHLGVDFHAH